MEDNRHRHQVIIVGGGITGLTQALILQHLNVDYVLLEAYGSVTPQVGASIGLYANGLRVLDQLGVYDDIVAKGQAVKAHIFRDGEYGTLISKRHMNQFMQERHGYPNIFMERHDLLCILHDSVKEKQRLLVNKKVVRVEITENCAVVYAKDGSTFEGQIVIGADGVHSTVRREMWRIADEESPGAIPAGDKKSISCEHACVFGTADPVPGIAPGDVIGASGRNTTAGCMGGPGGEVFLFWFWTLPRNLRSCPIDGIPRFTEDDKRRELARGADTVMAENGVKLSAVIDKLRHSSTTALPNFVLRRWHYGRVVIIGDAAHKFNPLVGQGGNSCIESCASLANALRDTLGPKLSVPGDWELSSLKQVFIAVENQRVDRVTDMVERCQDAMRGSAWETWSAGLSRRYVLPIIPSSTLANFYSSFITAGLSLEGFQPPGKPHLWSYDEEKGAGKGYLTTTRAIFALPITIVGFLLISKAASSQWLKMVRVPW